MAKRESRDVLRYTKKEKHRQTVRRHYDSWRESQGKPQCCDMPGCVFEKEPLVWNGQVLPLILDHVWGVNSDDGPKNLRLLCPNCDSQQKETRGGGNIGKVVERADGGYAKMSKSTGLRAFVLPADVSGTYRISGSDAVLVKHRLLPADVSGTYRISGSADAMLVKHFPIPDSKEPGS
jgi:hypothetical protein